MSDTIKTLTAQIDALKAENERLKQKVLDLETADIFWDSNEYAEGYCDLNTVLFGDGHKYVEFLSPIEVLRARSLPTIWAVISIGDLLVRDFPTKEEAEQFCQKMRDAQND